MGPVAIQDVTQLDPAQGKFPVPQTIIIDDGTGTPDGVPLAPDISSALTGAGLPVATPPRNQPTGTNVTPGTKEPNTAQQAYFADAVTKVILPKFAQSGKPFALLYWSRDPDGTQHFQGDSLNQLTPGINGPTSKAALKNADNNLKQILDYLLSKPELAANTDIFITADHGFATISKRDIDAAGHATKSYSAEWIYNDANGRQEVNSAFLPVGFLAIDLAHELGMPLFDPDSPIATKDGERRFAPVDPSAGQQHADLRQHPVSGNGLIGGTGRIANETDANVIVAANGGSDLIYVPRRDPALVKQIVAFLARQDYTGGLFVDDSYGPIPGALPSSSIRLIGSSQIPTPTIAIAFKTFPMDSKNPIMSEVEIADYPLQHGQGMHGSFGRSNTFQFMAAMGPDFKAQFADRAPVSNADIAPTLARILGLHLDSVGSLRGRVLFEALVGGPQPQPSERKVVSSDDAAARRRTILLYEQMGEQVYFDKACFTGAADHAPTNSCP
jgi:hypothetical protein